MVLLLDHYFCAGVGDYFHVGGGWNSKTRQMCSVPVKKKQLKNNNTTTLGIITNTVIVSRTF